MQPKVTNVREQNAIGPNNQPTKVIVITYYVGTNGPFTLTTNSADISSGAAALAMQQFAQSLLNLPGATT